MLDDPLPAHRIRLHDSLGAGTVFSLDLRLRSRGTRHDDPQVTAAQEPVLEEIARGDFDSLLVARARQIRDLERSRPFLHPWDFSIRFGFEMNGDWFAWGRKSEAYVKAYRRAHGIFAREGARSTWVFSPGALWGRTGFLRDLDRYYPGEAYVDVVGADGYNFGDEYDRWHSWQSFGGVFKRTLENLRRYGKPIWITEIGCAADRRPPASAERDPRKAAWTADFLRFLEGNPCVERFFWYNTSSRIKSEPDFRLYSDSASLRVFRAAFLPAGSEIFKARRPGRKGTGFSFPPPGPLRSRWPSPPAAPPL